MILRSDKEAAELLLAGRVGVMPTDTLYGIVARAADKKAVARLYALKHREHKPGTVIAGSIQQLIDLGIEEQYLRRVEAWWPGSLSVETPLGPELAYLHQDTGRQGFRVVSDARLFPILEQTGPLLTSSANLPGEAPSETIEQAQNYFGDDVDFYVDGGNRAGFKPSTIARITEDGIEIIRQGAVVIPEEALKSAPTGPVVRSTPQDCPFCLKNGKFKGSILYEDDNLFLTRPLAADSAFLVIPKIHAEQLTELSDLWWRHFKVALRNIPGEMTDYNLALNYGEAAGQTVKHLHFWVVLRSPGKPSSGKGLATLVEAVDNPAQSKVIE
jgi:L-threonylcarbamoyladenylate synthase